MNHSLPLSSPPRVKDRLQGLEWLRAAGAILVVVLHAGIPYLLWDMPGLVWPSHPAAEDRSALVNAICWGIDGFIMPLFILLSGYFAARLFKQRGADSFLKHRLARLGGPLLFGFAFILPLDLYAWLIGWVIEERIPASKLISLKIPPPLGDGLWGISHLWFLEYVLSYCVVAWAISRITHSQRPGRAAIRPEWVRSLPRGGGLAALLLGTAACGVLLYQQPRILLGFRHGWYPHLMNLMFFSVPFALGWFWDRPGISQRQERWESVLRIVAALALAPFLWPRLESHFSAESIPTADLWLPLEFAAFGLLLSTGLFGWAKSISLERAHPVVAYVAKASFWIYLLHHPLVGLSHSALIAVSLPGLVECLLTTAASLALCLLTYEVMVRKTWIGWLLNGVREGGSAPAVQPEESAATKRRAA